MTLSSTKTHCFQFFVLCLAFLRVLSFVDVYATGIQWERTQLNACALRITDESLSLSLFRPYLYVIRVWFGSLYISPLNLPRTLLLMKSIFLFFFFRNVKQMYEFSQMAFKSIFGGINCGQHEKLLCFTLLPEQIFRIKIHFYSLWDFFFHYSNGLWTILFEILSRKLHSFFNRKICSLNIAQC